MCKNKIRYDINHNGILVKNVFESFAVSENIQVKSEGNDFHENYSVSSGKCHNPNKVVSFNF